MDTNDTDPIIDTQAPDQTSEVKTEDQQKYQKILDEYSQQLEKNPPNPDTDQHPLPPQDILDPSPSTSDEAPTSFKPNLDIPIPPLPPTPPVSPTPDLPPSPPLTPPPPQFPQQQPPEPDPLPETPPPKKKFNLFKYLFYISALVFLVLVGLLVKDYLSLQQVSTSNLSSPISQPTATIIPTDIPTQTDIICNLNDTIYQLGDTVPSQDNCNTCTCQDDGTGPQIICTEEDCSQVTPSL